MDKTSTKVEAALVQKLSNPNMTNVESKSCVTVVDLPRTIVMYRVQESELRDLGDAQLLLTMNLAFFTSMGSVFVTLATVLLISHQVLSNRWLMLISALTLASLVLGAYYGFGTWKARTKIKQSIERLINDSRDADV